MLLYGPGRERGAVLAPVLLPLECHGRSAALLFPYVCAEMHYSGRPSEHLFTDFFVPVQI